GVGGVEGGVEGGAGGGEGGGVEGGVGGGVGGGDGGGGGGGVESLGLSPEPSSEAASSFSTDSTVASSGAITRSLRARSSASLALPSLRSLPIASSSSSTALGFP